MRFYLSNYKRTEVIQLPCPPSEIKVKRSQNNSTFETISLGELKTIGLMGLYSLGITSFFPVKDYPFLYDKRHKGMEYVNIIEKWRLSRQPLRLIITGLNINMPITIDDFEYGMKDGTGNVHYSMTISEYKDVSVSKVVQKINFNIKMKANLQNIGIVTSKGVNTCKIGTVNQSRRLEMFSMTIDNGLDFTYYCHMQDVGDTEIANEGSQIGSINKARRLEGIQINVTTIPFGYKLQYRCHIQNIGWTKWTNSGNYCGTKGKSLRVEAIEVRVVRG